ncbi:MAG: hypothetical protein PHC51_03895 [bacterium]|nr:hypothetical protein [bacterium]
MLKKVAVFAVMFVSLVAPVQSYAWGWKPWRWMRYEPETVTSKRVVVVPKLSAGIQDSPFAVALDDGRVAVFYSRTSDEYIDTLGQWVNARRIWVTYSKNTGDYEQVGSEFNDGDTHLITSLSPLMLNVGRFSPGVIKANASLWYMYYVQHNSATNIATINYATMDASDPLNEKNPGSKWTNVAPVQLGAEVFKVAEAATVTPVKIGANLYLYFVARAKNGVRGLYRMVQDGAVYNKFKNLELVFSDNEVDGRVSVLPASKYGYNAGTVFYVYSKALSSYPSPADPAVATAVSSGYEGPNAIYLAVSADGATKWRRPASGKGMLNEYAGGFALGAPTGNVPILYASAYAKSGTPEAFDKHRTWSPYLAFLDDGWGGVVGRMYYAGNQDPRAEGKTYEAGVIGQIKVEDNIVFEAASADSSVDDMYNAGTRRLLISANDTVGFVSSVLNLTATPPGAVLERAVTTAGDFYPLLPNEGNVPVTPVPALGEAATAPTGYSAPDGLNLEQAAVASVIVESAPQSMLEQQGDLNYEVNLEETESSGSGSSGSESEE